MPKLNYRILFPFGSIGSFRRPCDGNHKRTNFELQCMLEITLGCSKYSNGKIFCNLVLDSMSVSANFLLDKNGHIGEIFDCLRYDGELIMSVSLDGNSIPTKFNASNAKLFSFVGKTNTKRLHHCLACATYRLLFL